MKTKIISIILTSTFMLFLLGSCQKNFLNTTPQGKVPLNSFYQTDDQAVGAVMAAYDILQAMYSHQHADMWMLKVLMSGDVYTGGSRRGNNPVYESLNEFTYDASNTAIEWLFQMSYQGVYRTNLVIQYVKPDDPVKKRVIAEAKTLRALYYFDLVTLWGKVPLVTKPENDPSKFAQPRAEVSAIWAQIDKDLSEAIPDLPLKSKELYKARVSMGFAQALLGKSYLYQKKYDSAAIELQKVIDSHEYSLIPNYAERLRVNQEFGSESLFEISYSNTMGYSGGSNYNYQKYNSRVTESNIIEFMCAPRGSGYFSPGNTGLIAGWGFLNPSENIYNAYINAGDSVRRKASIMSEAELIAHGGKLRNKAYGNVLPYENVGLVRLKYGPFASEAGPPQEKFNFGTNQRIMEYDDVLLMASEAYNQLGQDEKALPLINEVRQRVKLPPLTVTGSALFAAIKKERWLELSFEGERYQDLVRWGDASKVLANQGKEIPLGNGKYYAVPGAGFKAKNVLLPIPEQELSVNPKMTQNPGY